MQETIVRQIQELTQKISDFNSTIKKKDRIAYGLAGLGLCLGVIAVTNPDKFTVNQLSVKNDTESSVYNVIEGVYTREAVNNPKGFARKVQIVGQIPGNELIVHGLLVSGVFALAISWLRHKAVTKQMVLLKQQRYELLRIAAVNTDSTVSAFLEVSAFNTNAEKQSRMMEREQEFKTEHSPNYSPEYIARLKTEQQRQQELNNLNHEVMVASRIAEIEKLNSQRKPKEVKKSELPVIEGITWFDWEWLETKDYDEFPHVRLVGKTGCGKTVLADYLLDLLEGDSKVLTIKRKPHQWVGRKVIGATEDYEALQIEFDKLEAERKDRLSGVEKGLDPDIVNIVIDEWRAIHPRVDRAKEIVRDTLTLSREAQQRLILLAQGRQVKTFGLEDESDLSECLVTFFMGSFARQEAQAYYNSAKHLPEDSKTKVMSELEKVGNRAIWVHSGFGDFPAIVPDLG